LQRSGRPNKRPMGRHQFAGLLQIILRRLIHSALLAGSPIRGSPVYPRRSAQAGPGSVA
jgi:hypothetical protein